MGGGSSRLIERAARAKRSQVDFHTSTVANRIQCQKNARVQNQAHQASFSDAACVLPKGLQCGRNDGSFPISGLACRRSRACSRSMSRSTQHPSQRRGLMFFDGSRSKTHIEDTGDEQQHDPFGCTSQGVGCIVLYKIQSFNRQTLTLKCLRSHPVLYRGIARRACLVYTQTVNESFPLISPTLQRCIR